MARKKRKLDEERDDNGNDNGSASFMKGLTKPIGKLKLEPAAQRDNQSVQEPEKDDGSAHGMPSPPESF
jgi:transcriptional activator SPT7